MKSADIKQFLASGTIARMGASNEVKERWPEIDGTNPKNWKRVAKFKVANKDGEYGDLSETFDGWKYTNSWFEFNLDQWPEINGERVITADCIVRVFYLEDSDAAQWAVVTNPSDTAIILVDDIGD